MSKKFWTLAVLAILLGTLVATLKFSASSASFLWNLSNGGAWLLPLVLVSSLLDSFHPCSFSILLITVALLFGMQMTRGKILRIGGIYILGIFMAYLFVGLGLLQALHLFNTPHFMGKLGAVLLVGFGLVNLASGLFPDFPVKLKIPSAASRTMVRLMDKISLPAAFGLGLLVGICQFPCMGGQYLMVIGLLRDQMTYFTGAGYLALYNLILILPLAVVLVIATDKVVVDQVQTWKNNNLGSLRWFAGLAMIALGVLIFFF